MSSKTWRGSPARGGGSERLAEPIAVAPVPGPTARGVASGTPSAISVGIIATKAPTTRGSRARPASSCSVAIATASGTARRYGRSQVSAS